MFSTQFCSITAVLLCTLLLQNCQPHSASIIEEEKPAVYSLSAPAVSAMRQCASSEPLAMWSLTSSSVSPVAPISPSRLTVPSNIAAPSTVSSTRSLIPFATGTTVMGNSPAVFYNPPATAMSRASHAVPLVNKLGALSPVFTASSGERMRFKQHDGQWCAVLVPGTSLNEQEHTLPVVSSGNIGALLSSLQGQDAWSSRSRIHVLATPTAPYSTCVYVGKVGLLGGAPASPGQGERQEPYTKFGKEEWEKYFGEVGEEPALPADMEATLDAPCPFWPERKVRDTHLLVLIPAKVDGKLFVLNKLNELVGNPQNGGHTAKCEGDILLEPYNKQVGNEAPASSYWLLLTRDVLPESSEKTYAAQKEIVAGHASRTGLNYELPKALEAATAILAHYVRTGERLYISNRNKNSKSWTYTRCQELVDFDHTVVVGRFNVVRDKSTLYIKGSVVVTENKSPADGVAACRRLCARETQEGKPGKSNDPDPSSGYSPALQIAHHAFSGYLAALQTAAQEGNENDRLVALKTLERVKWQCYFGEVGPIPDLRRDIITILDGACPFWPPKRVKDTHLLVLIPAEVDGKSFTLDLLEGLIKSPENGAHRAQYRGYDDDMKKHFGEIPLIPSSYWVLLTRDVLPESRNKTYAAQKEIVADASRKGMNYELPKALEAATAILTHYVPSGERLYTNSSSRCREEYKHDPVIVGQFDSSSLEVICVLSSKFDKIGAAARLLVSGGEDPNAASSRTPNLLASSAPTDTTAAVQTDCSEVASMVSAREDYLEDIHFGYEDEGMFIDEEGDSKPPAKRLSPGKNGASTKRNKK